MVSGDGKQGNRDTHASQVTVPCIMFFVLTPIFLIIRLWSRFNKGSGLGMDDMTIVISFACTLAVQILMMFSVKYGFGQHLHHLSHDDRLMCLKLFYVAQIFYKITINLTKASIVLLYLRIFVQRWFRICCYVLLGLFVAYMIATVAASIWQCNPIEGAWDKSMKPTCISLTKNWYANAGYSIATDVLILCLPMQPIWKSKLPINQKRALMIVFALGGFVTITSIMRATTLRFSTTSPDPTYDITSTLWTMIEENVAIICACLPMCRIVLAWIFPQAFSSPPTAASGGEGSNGPVYTFGSAPKRLSPPQSDDDWQPYPGPSKREASDRRVVRQHPEHSNSEEFILQPVTKPAVDEADGGAIRKTTYYEISYERDPYNKL
ncbi:hypothetical protein NOR_01206 [Metarhizium rileyi]|uniref:Rhodopsin domain-containing protein n=1 Tax=Metarhizium rileyi (strain RCEF 4871) TaxID=1649241 RepID=A0A167IP82_METRR|nr:hypothetical protein NOR_01206 [Metarhizium rileyi RCEF 4871]TWU77849.1 hypothetical protein ED733_003041 [Metarhizium rileyi]